MSDEEPIGRARWIGVADEPLRRSMSAKRKQAGHEFAGRRGSKSDWHEVYSLEAMEEFECHSDFETEWFGA